MRVQGLDRSEQRLRLHHHARSASERRVVDGPVGIRGPVAEIVEHEDEVIVMLECLTLHSRYSLHVVFRLFVIKLVDLILHEAGEFDVERRITLADVFEQESADAWYTHEARELLPPDYKCKSEWPA